MHVEIETEAAQFQEKKYINGIFLAVYPSYIAMAPHSVRLIKTSFSDI
jgi:hypothetical protein